MINNAQIQKKIVFLLLTLIILIPWFNTNYFDDIKPVELGTEDTSFYEINPCQVSLAEYIKVDFQSISKTLLLQVRQPLSNIMFWKDFRHCFIQQYFFYIYRNKYLY